MHCKNSDSRDFLNGGKINRREFMKFTGMAAASAALTGCESFSVQSRSSGKRPNIIFIMTDDHASHAMSCYGSRINKTPNLDRIAEEGMKFENCFCTNSICAPSRAVIFTGKYSHRNWIVIADSAYPKQSAPGIETIVTGKEQIEVLDVVLDAIADARHVKAIVTLDAELDSVTESDAPGVTEYRSKLKASLKGKKVKVMPHEDIIRELDKVAEMFNILLLKTDLTIPYTSVFLQLDCGYWNAEKEKRLRDTIANKN
jgi:hypothetical protein